MEPAPLEGLSVEEWADKLEEPYRPDRPPRPFDSWFEVQVFVEIARRGFRVIPQYEVGGYRIDLVVEGMAGKLAVECDGDRWHGPEQFDKDLSRQLELERAGFQFWRVRGSTFYRDPQGALEDLWKTLARAGVSPYANPAKAIPIPQTASTPSSSALPHPRIPSTPMNAIEDNTDTDEEPPSLLTLFQSILQPYKEWSTKTILNPEFTSNEELIETFSEIIAVEGPVLCELLYLRYLQYSNKKLLSKSIKSKFNKAVTEALRQKRIMQLDEYGIQGQIKKTVRIVKTPVVSIREKGTRPFHLMPPLEIAALMHELHVRLPKLSVSILTDEILKFFNVFQVKEIEMFTVIKAQELFAKIVKKRSLDGGL